MVDRPAKEVAEWLERGKHDFESARVLFQQEGHGDTISFLLQQAVEKHLKGYLISKGWKLQKTHDLEVLVTKAMEYDEAFGHFLDLGRALSGYYLEERYPPSPPREFRREEILNLLEQAGGVIDKIRRETQ